MTYIIEVSYEGVNSKIFREYHRIPFDVCDIKRFVGKLNSLAVNTINRIPLAFGGQDIDILKKDEKYTIIHSPNSAIYYYFDLKNKEVDTIIKTFNSLLKDKKLAN